MRKDFAKVLTERARIGHGMKHRYVRNRKGVNTKNKLGAETWPFDGESGSPYPHKEGIKKPYVLKGHTKSLNENLSPLHHFLQSSVGKTWDKVYGDVCQTFDRRKTVNQHVIGHLFDFVEVNTFMDNGGKVSFIETRKYRGSEGSQTIDHSHCDFYVHPVSRLLLTNKNKITFRQIYADQAKTKEVEKTKNLVLLSKFNNQNGNGARYAIKINSIWYEISVIKTPGPEKRRRTNAQGETEYFTHYPSVDSISIHGAKFEPPELEDNKFYVSRKTQLNTAQLRKLSLS